MRSLIFKGQTVATIIMDYTVVRTEPDDIH